MAKWRPEGWNSESIVVAVYQELTTESTDEKERKLVEAGADAMLEAIQEHFNLTLLSLDYKEMPLVVKPGDRLVIGIKPESSEMPFFLSDICFNKDSILSNISISEYKQSKI